MVTAVPSLSSGRSRNSRGGNKPRRCLVLLLVCLLIVLCSATHLFPSLLVAQEKLRPALHFTRTGTFSTAGQGNITARVVRDSLGFVWVGTSNGLQRYDGYDFKVYRNNPLDSTSIPSNRIYSLLVDRKGRLWVGTQDEGVCLYDGPGDRFLQLYPGPRDSTRRELPTVYDMKEDQSGNIWLAMEHPDDLVRVEVPAEVGSNNPDTLIRAMQFRSFPVSGTPGDGRLLDVCERNDGKILATSLRGLIILDPSTGVVSRPHLAGSIGRCFDTLAAGSGLLQASDGNLWVGSATRGVFRIDWESGKVVNFRYREGDSLSLNSDEIWDIAEDPRGNLWIGTFNGIDLFSPKTGLRVPFRTYAYPPPVGKVRIRLSFDCRGTLWVGTFPYLEKLTLQSQFFSEYSSTGGVPPARNGDAWVDSYQAIKRTPDGQLWAFSDGNLLQLDIAAKMIVTKYNVCSLTNYSESPFGPTSSLLDDKGNFWWAGGDLGLYRVNLATGVGKNYRRVSSLRKATTFHSIAHGTGGWMWVGALDEGVFKFNPDSGRFLATDIKYGRAVMADHEGKVWITTNDGMCVFDPATGTTARFTNVPSDPNSLSPGLPSSTYEDFSGRIWVSVGNVVNLWQPTTRSFIRYSNPAFSDQVGDPIGTDSRGRVWITYLETPKQPLSILDPSNGGFTNFSHDDGLCYGVTDMVNLADGRILLTGPSGVVVVSADRVYPDRTPPPFVLTRMTINDTATFSPAFLKKAGLLHLSHAQNVFEFEFAAVDIDSRGPVEYRYQLEGLEKDWVKPEGRRYVRYTGVPPGDYVFKVKASSVWDRWPDQEIAIAISIAPPWWRTMWAYGAYVFLFVGLLYAGYRLRLRQVHLQQEVEMEHFQREHLSEVDRLKSRFFANISHEFRTPLTLILGPIQKWRDKAHEEDQRKDLGMAERNAHRLLRLINQLLDLSKLEAGAMKLRASRMNIVPLVKGIAYSFETSAGIRRIELNVTVDQEEIELYCDKDMVEKILSNLMSNAFKFTPEGGRVEVALTPRRVVYDPIGSKTRRESSTSPSPRRVESSTIGRMVSRHESGRGEGCLEIKVSDTGIGIPADQLDKIFDRFYQVDASQTREHEGSGIGLALVKELVELHHGTIRVQSEVGKGTTFTVQLPLGRSHLKDDEIVDVPARIEPTIHEVEGALADNRVEESKEEIESERAQREKPIVLVVEDNADVRAYIKSYLVPTYQVTEARDGEEGIQKAQEAIPDLIISDVMMPKKDGYEVCKTLKLDERTSHIPIILLTAKAASENRIEGLEIGADDYLIKPFEPKELLARVKNLIDLRRKLRERFKASVPLRPGEVAVTSMDDAFLQKVKAVVELHIGDEGFSVEDLGNEVGMSRSQIHRKLTALTGMSATDFVRYLRLHRAKDLLKQNAATVAEIAYSVGFGSPAHFTKCFHDQFGMTPTEVRHPEQ